MADQKPSGMRGWSRGAVLTVAIVAAVGTAAIAALLVNIMEKKGEAQNAFFRVVELTDDTIDPAIWGKNFPQQYDGYLRTVDQQRTRYGGSEAMPHSPTEADPRSIVAQSRLEEDPRLKTMWAGYAFAVDFRKKRGHAYMLEDQTFTERVQHFKQPGTCIHCHASVYVPYKKAGNGDLIKGFEHYNQMPYAEARKDFAHPIALHRLPCRRHDGAARHAAGFHRRHSRAEGEPGRQGLRRQHHGHPAGDAQLCLRAMPRRVLLQGPGEAADLSVGEGPEGRPDLRVLPRGGLHRLDPRGERRAGAQGPASRVRNVEPGHSRALGVACADCHMPYTREGAMKISDHHVRSPMLNINNACQTCHKWPEDELRGRVERSRRALSALRNRAMDVLVALIADVKAAKAAGATGAAADRRARIPAPRTVLSRLRRVRELQRLPRAAGSRAHPRRGDRLPAAGTVGVAAGAGARHVSGPALSDRMTDAVFQIPPAFDYLATLTWASSGALVGIRKHFDVVGVFVVALVSSLGSAASCVTPCFCSARRSC